MKHPILGGIGLIYYGLIWTLLMTVHAAGLYFYFSIPLIPSLQDSLVYNITFAALGLGLWYIVRFSMPEGTKSYRPLITILTGGLFTVSLWYWISSSILQIMPPDPVYANFSENSQLWRIISGALYFAVLVLIYYSIFYSQNLREQTNSQLKLATAVKEAELNMLKSQINPHFIFNSLNSISSLTMSDPHKAQQMIIKLSSFLRYSIGKDNRETNRLKEEISNIQLYLDIEKIRFGDRLQFQKQVPENCESCTIPNLILQPLLENSIKHGVQESIGTINVQLTAKRLPTSLRVEIVNNFDSETASQKGAGIGLKNIRQRLALLFGSEDLLQYGKEGNLFKVILEIPQS